MQELGIFGGTFNPIHNGHLLIAEMAREQFQLDKVLFMTGANLPHRTDVQVPAEARYEMVQAAISDNPWFEASRLELERQGPSYTVDTLRQLKALHSQSRLNLIIGGDNVEFLSTWHEANDLFKLCRILIAVRPPMQEQNVDLSKYQGASFEFIDLPPIGIASTIIRKRLAECKSIKYMVPEAVHLLLQERGYYHDAS